MDRACMPDSLCCVSACTRLSMSYVCLHARACVSQFNFDVSLDDYF